MSDLTEISAALGRIWMVLGVPDSGTVPLRLPNARRRPLMDFPGTASFRNYLPVTFPQDREIWFGPPEGPIRLTADAAPLINFQADADIYSIALNKTQRLVSGWNVPCFNSPSAVLATTRDQVARRLTGVRGLIVPRTERWVMGDKAGLEAAIVAAGLTWPVLVRLTGQHGGDSLVKLDSPKDLHACQDLPATGTSIYVTEFQDFREADGYYRKYRLVVVGRQIILRHILIGHVWLLHALRRAPETDADEEARMARFETDLLPVIQPAVLEIADRLGLDYFGIDCNIDAEGQILLFEANACMNVLHRTDPPPNMWDKPIAEAEAALMDLLAHPERWRHQPAI